MSGQFQAVATLPPEKEPTTPIKQEIVWDSGQGWVFWSRQKILTLPRNEPRFFARLAHGGHYIHCPIQVICDYKVLNQM